MAGKILVVDDVATNRIVLKAKLSLACYEVLQAADGPQALSLAASARPDLILLDLAMPGMDGLQVLQALKRDPATARIPVIVVTGHADTSSRIAGLRAGADDFLAKPVDDAALSARVRSLLRDRVPERVEPRLSDGPELAPRGDRAATAHDASSRDTDAPDAGAVRRAALRNPVPCVDGWARPRALQGGTEEGPPAEIALISRDPATLVAWRRALGALEPARLRTIGRAEGLRLARVDGREDVAADPARGTRPPRMPDVFIISADIEATGDGLMLLSELRAGAATRHAAILVAVPRARAEIGPMALDLGACDLLLHPVAPEEMALRVAAQLARKREADRERARLQTGLKMALTDALTGLGNRRFALSQLAQLQQDRRATGRPHAVLLLDLDRFKQVNDRFGHAAGDAVLHCVATRLARALRGGDVLSRFGGEEFLVALPDTDLAGAQVVAERLRRAVSDTPIALPAAAAAAPGGASRATGPAQVLQTVSIGIACSDDDDGAEMAAGPDGSAGAEVAASGLIARADRALYAAKASGRDCVRSATRRRSDEAAA